MMNFLTKDEVIVVLSVDAQPFCSLSLAQKTPQIPAVSQRFSFFVHIANEDGLC